ncbi:PLPL2 protein, partial [Chroicocephalus maculipennis]|nr:PLPL2 protein [Chroicocephalus maculipennis]
MLDRERGWSVSFAGCGFLGVYHIGAATCLQERAPHVIRDARHIYGASAGALAGAVLVGGGSLGQRLRSAAPAFCLKSQCDLSCSPLSLSLVMGGGDPILEYISLRGNCIFILLRTEGRRKRSWNALKSVELIINSFLNFQCFNMTYSWRYVDGGISDNLPHYESKNTITVSPFAGECDICPKGNSANFHEMNVTNTSIQLSLGNLYRLTQALFPPEPKVLGEICEQGYSDALKFLKENGML